MKNEIAKNVIRQINLNPDNKVNYNNNYNHSNYHINNKEKEIDIKENKEQKEDIKSKNQVAKASSLINKSNKDDIDDVLNDPYLFKSEDQIKNEKYNFNKEEYEKYLNKTNNVNLDANTNTFNNSRISANNGLTKTINVTDTKELNNNDDQLKALLSIIELQRLEINNLTKENILLKVNNKAKMENDTSKNKESSNSSTDNPDKSIDKTNIMINKSVSDTNTIIFNEQGISENLSINKPISKCFCNMSREELFKISYYKHKITKLENTVEELKLKLDLVRKTYKEKLSFDQQTSSLSLKTHSEIDKILNNTKSSCFTSFNNNENNENKENNDNRNHLRNKFKILFDKNNTNKRIISVNSINNESNKELINSNNISNYKSGTSIVLDSKIKRTVDQNYCIFSSNNNNSYLSNFDNFNLDRFNKGIKNQDKEHYNDSNNNNNDNASFIENNEFVSNIMNNTGFSTKNKIKALDNNSKNLDFTFKQSSGNSKKTLSPIPIKNISK